MKHHPMRHRLYVNGDYDAPSAIKDRNGEVVRAASSGQPISVIGPDLEWLPPTTPRNDLARLLNVAYRQGWRDGQAAHVAALAGLQTFMSPAALAPDFAQCMPPGLERRKFIASMAAQLGSSRAPGYPDGKEQRESWADELVMLAEAICKELGL